ncbi:MAG: phospho-sugar mutase [Bacillota bacterium]|nr:phospho-sugar mutase [Bacillota bacterium]
MEYRDIYSMWLESPYITDSDRKVLESMTAEEVHEAFYKAAEFGTGGMRGIMGLGTNRMNRYTIRLAAKAFAEILPKKAKVAVAYDTRNGSGAFAEETAKVLAACGIKVYLFDRPSPVPLLSFAVRQLKADGGVVITASHNTGEYNGFKVYDESGCQMLPDRTEQIARAMAAIGDPTAIETVDTDDFIAEPGLIVHVGDEMIGQFQAAISDCGKAVEEIEPEKLKVVYTPLHGSGRDYVMDALAGAGFTDVKLVPGQAEFDGDFPTVKKPNPEDPAALEMAAEMAEDADIIIGTDPDCDRVGVGVIERAADTGCRKLTCLTGNQTGVLLIDYLSRKSCAGQYGGAGKRLITTIVTGEMGPLIARDRGMDVEYVLTGFKYIGEVMNRMDAADELKNFFMGYEESYGYLAGTHARDKDGVSSALAICRMAAYHKAKGRTLTEVLAELYGRYGYWLDSQESLVYDGSRGEETMIKIMESFRKKGAGLFREIRAGEGSVSYRDYRNEGSGLPKADVLKYSFGDGSWVAVRPSGTEPKIKIYYCIKGENEAAAHIRKEAAAECIHKLTGVY